MRVTVWGFFKKAVHSVCVSSAHPFSVLCESAGQYWDAFKVSWEYVSGSKEKPHLFLRTARVFWLSARHCAFVPQTQASTLILCQMKGYSNSVPCLTLLYQEIDELLPNPEGVHVFFSSWQDVERSEDDSSLLKEPDFRFIQPFRLMRDAKHAFLCLCLCRH